MVFLVLLFGSCTYGFLSGLRSDLYHGRVVDEESGAPLAGAVITVIWSKTAAISIEGGPTYFLNAQETVADNDGKFSLRVSPGLNWHPFTLRVHEPWIVIFQPAYEPLMLHTLISYGFKTEDALVSDLKSGVTVKLRKLKKEELPTYTDRRMVYPIDTPWKRVPNLLRAINEQSKMAGLPGYTIESP